MMKAKNKNWTPKFIALFIISFLIGWGICSLTHQYFQGMKLPGENPAEEIYPAEVKFTYFDDREKINNTAGFLIKLYEPIAKDKYGSQRVETLRNSGVRLLQASEIPTVLHSLIEENKVEEVENLDFVEYVYPYKTRIDTANKSKTFEEEFEGILEDRFQSVLNSYWQRGETPPPMNPHGYFYLITNDKEYHISSSQLGKIAVKYEDFPIHKDLRKPAKIIGNVSDGELYPDKIIIGSVIYEKQTTKIEPTKEMPTMMDISHLTPQPGEYFTYRGNKSKILLSGSRLKYCFLELKDICPPDEANVGDPGIVITGTIKNEYDRDYYICMFAHAFNSEGEKIGHSIDSKGPICGVIAPYVKSGKTGDFELHLKYREDIERIALFIGCMSEIPPP
ncbi:hypothetical protein ES705_22982 [subsurface metagenome]